jgi:hypothetical protein
MADDQIEKVVPSEALNAKLVDFIESRIMDPDPILKAQFDSAPEVVNAMGELAGSLHLGDNNCYSMVVQANESDQLGLGCVSSGDGDFLLLRALSEALVETHPATSLLLLSLSPPYGLSGRYKARLIDGAKDLVERIENIEQPGLVELNSLINYSEGLDRSSNREQVTMLCMAQAILTRLEEEGQTLSIERAKLRYVAKNHFNIGQQALPDYLSFYSRATDPTSDKEPDDYAFIAKWRLNPLFQLMLDHSRARNHLGSTLDESLNRLLKLLNPAEATPSPPKPTPWLTEGPNALLSRQPENVLKLALNTFQVPVERLIKTVKRSPNNTNLNWYMEYTKLAETSRIQSLNLHFDATTHDPAERRAAFTNLLILTIKLGQEDLLKIHDAEKAKVAVDDLLQTLAPHADMAAISPALTDTENDLWAGYILRHHRHLHNLVPLKSIGNNFSHDLGV